jgi:hypothetical protein
MDMVISHRDKHSEVWCDLPIYLNNGINVEESIENAVDANLFNVISGACENETS